MYLFLSKARKDQKIRNNCKEQVKIYKRNRNAIAYFQVITVHAPGEKTMVLNFLVLHVSGLLLASTGVG